jgi:hypothetical protein
VAPKRKKRRVVQREAHSCASRVLCAEAKKDKEQLKFLSISMSLKQIENGESKSKLNVITMFECAVCQAQATSAKALKQHAWAMHGAGNQPATCAGCGVTKTLYWLCNHKRVCHAQPKIACSLCEGKTYKNHRSYLKHLQSATHAERAEIAARTPMIFIDYSRIPAPLPAFVHVPANVPPPALAEQWSFEGGFDDVGAFDAGVFAAPVSATDVPLFADDAPMPPRADDIDDDDDDDDVNEPPPPPPPPPPPSETQVLDLSQGSRVVCMLVNMWCSCGVHVGGM